MKKIKTFLNSITIICVISVLFCTCANNQSSRKAIVSGQLTGSIPVEQNRDSTIITLSVPNPILLGGERIEYETTPKGDGTFTVSIPLLCSTYAGISIDYGEDAGYLFVSPGKETKIEVFFNEAGETQIRMIDGKGLTREEIGKMYEVSMDVLPALQDGRNSPDFQLNMPPKAYADSMFIRMERDLSIVKTTTKIPEESKQLLYNTMRLSYLNYFLLDYEEQMRLFYLNLHFGEDVNENDFTPITPDRSYYSFLKDFDLNHPPYFDYVYYPMILESLLDNKVLNIPPIEDLPIKDWMKEVKAIMADLIGADTGLFYDLLAAKTYHKQFTDELKPLSDKQKENIQTYFKNPSFAAILFAENEKILEAVREISKYKKETPAVPKEELMNAIIARYKGKVVFVDFWATWCGPCLDAMRQSKPLKSKMQDKPIVFVYITNPTSKFGLWKKKVIEIGGEQYYLTREEWDYLLDSFDFSGIPTYLLYDANGVFKNKITGYPGNDEMRKMIEELLP